MSNNDRAKYYFNQGVSLFRTRDYKPALKELEHALGLVEPWDTQLREKMLNFIQEVRLCAKDKEELDKLNSQLESFKNAGF